MKMTTKKIIIKEEVGRLWTFDNIFNMICSIFAFVLSCLLYGTYFWIQERNIILTPFINLILLFSCLFLMISFLYYLSNIKKEKQIITREVEIEDVKR